MVRIYKKPRKVVGSDGKERVYHDYYFRNDAGYKVYIAPVFVGKKNGKDYGNYAYADLNLVAEPWENDVDEPRD